MKLDLRLPMGLFFTLVGVILTLTGLKTNGNAALYASSLGMNADLWWGLVLLAFGLSTLLLGRRGQMRLENKPSEPAKKPKARREDRRAGKTVRGAGSRIG